MTQARTLSLIGSALTVNTSTYNLTVSNNVTITANLTVNNSTINSLTANGTINFGTSSITNNSIFIGNSSVNTNISNSTVTVANATSSTTIGSGYISSSNTTLVGATTIGTTFEALTITNTFPPTSTNFDVLTQSTLYYTSTTSPANFAVNVRGDSTTTLNSILPVGKSATISILVNQPSATGYYPSSLSVDGVSQTIKYQFGSSFFSDPNTLSLFTFTIIKTSAAPAYTVLASQTRYT